MNRFYVPKSCIGTEEITINNSDDVRHLTKALRIKMGEELLISDGDGSSYIAQVDKISKQVVALKIKKRAVRLKRDEMRIKITLASAIPKWTSFEEIVAKTTQLGVDTIVPLLTERTLIARNSFEKKRGRLRRIMEAAAKQSGILFLPELKDSMPFEDLVSEAHRYDCCLLPNLSQTSVSLKDSVTKPNCRNILILIGPEGDFTQREINMAMEAGFKGISLGESVLRVDTAAIAVVSFLRLYL